MKFIEQVQDHCSKAMDPPLLCRADRPATNRPWGHRRTPWF